MMCSARSFSSASSSSASAASSAGVAPRRRVPAIGRTVTAFAFQAHEYLGRGADDVEIAEVEVVHVGRRIDRAQRPVERERRGAVGLGHALRRHDLHDVAVADVALGALDRRVIRRLAEARHGRLGRDAKHRPAARPARAAARAAPRAARAPRGTHRARRLLHTRPASASPTGCRRSRSLRRRGAGCRARRARRACTTPASRRSM